MDMTDDHLHTSAEEGLHNCGLAHFLPTIRQQQPSQHFQWQKIHPKNDTNKPLKSSDVGNCLTIPSCLSSNDDT